MKKHNPVIVILLFFFAGGLYAQKVGDVTAEVKDGKVVVHYYLDAKFFTEIDVSLFVSRDNGKTFEGPLKEVTGDVSKVSSKGAKVIIWDPMREMPFVSETLVFDVRAEITRNRPKRSFYVMYVGNTTTYLGLRAGMLGRIGFYAELRGNLNGLNNGDYIYKDSTLNYNQPGYYTFTGTKWYAAFSAIGGMSYQPAKNLFFYLGVGYGKDDFMMKIDEFSYEGDLYTGSSFVKYDEYSYSGVEIDLGLMFRIKRLMISAGGTMINFENYGWTAGIGLSF